MQQNPLRKVQGPGLCHEAAFEGDAVSDMQRRLRSVDCGHAWEDFLARFASTLLHVARALERDPDKADDCFLFICEKLSEKNFRRLLKFRPDGPARFSTWLKAVARNLCLDWQRRARGRLRPFRSVSQLSDEERAVFDLVFQRGHSHEEALRVVRCRFPALDPDKLDSIVDNLSALLTSRQRWYLSRRRNARVGPEPLATQDDESAALAIADERPGPEAIVGQLERDAAVRRALSRLTPEDRLILRLRFDDEVTLEQVARTVGLANAQAADRRVRDILGRLREYVQLAGGTAESVRTCP